MCQYVRFARPMTAESIRLIQALKEKREAEGLSIRALSTEIGVSFSALARLERGEGEPDNNSTIRILNWLGAEAEEYGLSYEQTALVHFRAAKNVNSKTIHCLLKSADAIKKRHSTASGEPAPARDEPDQYAAPPLSLSKSEMETMAEKLRAELNVGENDRLDSLSVRVIGVELLVPADVAGLSKECRSHLCGQGSDEWSAMSVPLNSNNTKWAVLRNDGHNIERQRVTYLEECWHIMLGHKLTRIAKVADAYGRTYDANEEHDAYYLASASLLPRKAIESAVEAKFSATKIAKQFGVSPELVEYRIKRLGLWRLYKGISVKLAN